MAQKTGITIQSIQKEHEEYQRLALAKGDMASATANLIAKGKTIAAYADKAINVPSEMEALTRQQAEEARRLASIRLLGTDNSQALIGNGLDNGLDNGPVNGLPDGLPMALPSRRDASSTTRLGPGLNEPAAPCRDVSRCDAHRGESCCGCGLPSSRDESLARQGGPHGEQDKEQDKEADKCQ